MLAKIFRNSLQPFFCSLLKPFTISSHSCVSEQFIFKVFNWEFYPKYVLAVSKHLFCQSQCRALATVPSHYAFVITREMFDHLNLLGLHCQLCYLYSQSLQGLMAMITHVGWPPQSRRKSCCLIFLETRHLCIAKKCSFLNIPLCLPCSALGLLNVWPADTRTWDGCFGKTVCTRAPVCVCVFFEVWDDLHNPHTRLIPVWQHKTRLCAQMLV